jgi:hypothetical protein
MKDEAERSAYDQGQEDGYSKGWAAGNEHEDALDAEIAKLKAERDAAFVRGLEWAKDIAYDYENVAVTEWEAKYGDRVLHEAIQAEIDKAKG